MKLKPVAKGFVPEVLWDVGRRFLRSTGVRSYTWSDGFWWYRWHPDAGIGSGKDWEATLERYILHPGSCFVDVGSSVGHWTVRASRYYGRVLAFEPDPFTNSVLRRNIGRNDIHNVIVFSTALSNRRTRTDLFNFGPLACNSLRKTHVSGKTAKTRMSVEVRPLDDFASYIQGATVLKIDVEGEELRVLEGAAHVIDSVRPLIVVEVHFSDELRLVRNEIVKHGYQIELLADESADQFPAHLVAKPPN